MTAYVKQRENMRSGGSLTNCGWGPLMMVSYNELKKKNHGSVTQKYVNFLAVVK